MRGTRASAACNAASSAPALGGVTFLDPIGGVAIKLTELRRGASRRVAWVAAAVAAGGCVSDEPLQQPAPLFEAAPFEFPMALWDSGVEGETVLMVHITPMGTVDSAYVHESSGYAQFDSAAIAGAHLLRFTPGRRGERRVDLWARLPVRFNRTAQAGEAGQLGPPARDSLSRADDGPDPEIHL